MKLQFAKNLFVFIITLMMLSAVPGIATAQKKCHNGHCPNNYTCVGGYCVPVSFCNCFVRPIPYECGQICGFYTDPNHKDNMLSITDMNSYDISLKLIEAQNVSLKIYDITGRLIKTLADSKFSPGELQLEWNQTDETGGTVSAGVYYLQLNVSADNQGMKKLLVIN